MNRLTKLAAALAVVPVLAFSGAVALAADSNSGQIEMGNNYRVRNITVNPSGSFSDPVSATCNETVQFRYRIHNPGPDPITNVKIAVTLDGNSGTSHSSMASVSADNVGGEVVTDTAGVNLDKPGTLNYVSGTTELVDPNGVKLNGLPDGIVTNGAGINIGTVGVSLQQIRSVQFQAKVNCPTPTPVVRVACTELTVAQVDRTRFNFTAKADVQNATITSWDFIVKDANGKTIEGKNYPTNANSQTHPYTQSTAGNYSVSAIVNTDHGSDGGSNCTNKQFTVSAAPATPTTPAATTPTTIPNTGAGDVLGIFAGASALGTAGHMAVRRFRR